MTFKTINLKKILSALPRILAPLVLGFAVSMLIGDTREFYFSLDRPPLSPPPVLFPVVWSILYLLMGISSYLARDCKTTQWLFYAGLFMNLLWTVLFFSFNLIGFSAIWIVLLTIQSLITLVSFLRCNSLSGLLFVPYILWLIFASYLNIAIYFLNR